MSSLKHFPLLAVLATFSCLVASAQGSETCPSLVRLHEGLELAEQSAAKLIRSEKRLRFWSDDWESGVATGMVYTNMVALWMDWHLASYGMDHKLSVGMGATLLAASSYVLSQSVVRWRRFTAREAGKRMLQVRALQHGLTLAKSQTNSFPQSPTLIQARARYPEVDLESDGFEERLDGPGFRYLRSNSGVRKLFGLATGAALAMGGYATSGLFETAKIPYRVEQAMNGIEPSSPIRVRHFAQTHFADGATLADMADIGQSQARLWDLLRFKKSQGDSLIVFAEGLDRDLGPDDRRLLPGYEEIHAAFPNGPVASTKMNAHQRWVMSREGAEVALYALGELDRLYATENRELNQRASDTFDPMRAPNEREFRETVIVSREIEALRRIAEQMHNDPEMRKDVEAGKREILLIYGSAHDFSRFGSEHFTITREY